MRAVFGRFELHVVAAVRALTLQEPTRTVEPTFVDPRWTGPAAPRFAPLLRALVPAAPRRTSRRRCSDRLVRVTDRSGTTHRRRGRHVQPADAAAAARGPAGRGARARRGAGRRQRLAPTAPGRGSRTQPGRRAGRLPTNSGGAGGFHDGLGWAVERGADLVWLMDDDGLPDLDCLSRLLDARRPRLLGTGRRRRGRRRPPRLPDPAARRHRGRCAAWTTSGRPPPTG